ncbi:RnfABCDGE type electron transport complex subunit D [Planctomycetales bacterium ZRK34]|nr:RnfABCDGE type electron transport complex subunit D [Planctomycetales bacterium ZRK34]
MSRTVKKKPAGGAALTKPAPKAAVVSGPPWIGPVVPLYRYDRLWLGIYVSMGLVATIFFGWRAAFMICLTAAMSLLVFMLTALAIHVVRGRAWQGSLSQALNMGLLMGLVMPLMQQLSLAVIAGALIGVLVHVTGPTHRVRVHPVAAAYLVLMMSLPLVGQQQVGAVLAPSRVVVGDVWRFSKAVGPNWMSMTVPEQYDAIRLQDPQRQMRQQQHDILRLRSRLIELLRRGELQRIEDVMIGATPGPVGATSQVLLIALGLWLMYRRVGRWVSALAAIGAAMVTLMMLPVAQDGHMTMGHIIMSWQGMIDVGWMVSIAYLGYQLLASPLLLVVLIMMPLTAPRTSRGRFWYAVLIGAGVVTVRWFIPLEGVAFVPLVLGGLLCPLLDRLQQSPFVAQTAS